MTGKSGLLLAVIGPRFNRVIETRVEELENLKDRAHLATQTTRGKNSSKLVPTELRFCDVCV